MTFIYKESITSGMVYSKKYNIVGLPNSFTLSQDKLLYLNSGTAPSYLVEVDTETGDVNHLITQNTYSWDKDYCSISISQDEAQAYISMKLTSDGSGAICKWEIGTTNYFEWISLGTFYFPSFILGLPSNDIFIQTNIGDFNGDLYFIRMNLDANNVIWDKKVEWVLTQCRSQYSSASHNSSEGILYTAVNHDDKVVFYQINSTDGESVGSIYRTTSSWDEAFSTFYLDSKAYFLIRCVATEYLLALNPLNDSFNKFLIHSSK